VLRWGVLGVSHFATHRMIPALQAGRDMTVAAIASRERPKAEAAARELGIARAYGSYEELLADPEIDAVYNPLPNHLHLPWSVRAAEAGKHVLCEKPIALNAAEARALVAARDRTGRLILEAAMVRVHPRWLAVRAALRAKAASATCASSPAASGTTCAGATTSATAPRWAAARCWTSGSTR
jgi:predicted dehydrogenase